MVVQLHYAVTTVGTGMILNGHCSDLYLSKQDPGVTRRQSEEHPAVVPKGFWQYCFNDPAVQLSSTTQLLQRSLPACLYAAMHGATAPERCYLRKQAAAEYRGATLTPIALPTTPVLDPVMGDNG